MIFDIESWVKDNLERPKRSKGNEWTAVCPSCGKWSKFYVNVETGSWVCFGERPDFQGKKIWGLIAHVEGISPAQARAECLRQGVRFERRRRGGLELLAERAAELRGREVEDEVAVNADLPEEYIPVFKEKRRRTWMYPKYLKQRGIKKSTCADWGIGYARGGDYEGRIIIPISCPNGYSFTARGTEEWHKPKYLNPPDADHSRLLIGWDHVDVRSDVALVEGPTDAIANYQNGIPSYALGGKELSDAQMGLLCRKPADAAITVMLDPEEVKAANGVARKLALRFPNVYIARLPLGEDPGSATRKVAWAAFDGAERYDGKRTSGMAERIRAL